MRLRSPLAWRRSRSAPCPRSSLPAVSSSFVDVAADTAATASLIAITPVSTTMTYAYFTKGNGVTLDQLGSNLSAFSVQTVTLQ